MNFSKRGDALAIPNLIDVQIESYQRFLQKEVEVRQAQGRGPGGAAARSLPHRKLRREPSPGVHQLRPVRAALHHRRVPGAAADLRHAVPHPGPLRPQGQGRGDGRLDLPRRNPHHDRRRRVHHQRRRARDREPASTARRAWTSWSKCRRATARCTAAGSSPSAEAGSNARSPRRTRWPSASTRAARSPRPPSCGRWTRSTARTEAIIREFYTVENGQGRQTSRPTYYAASADHRRRERRRAGQGRRADRRGAEQDPGEQPQDASSASPRSPTR